MPGGWSSCSAWAERPFEAELSWSAGSGTGARALLTVARASRVSVYARSLQLRARNLGPERNRRRGHRRRRPGHDPQPVGAAR